MYIYNKLHGNMRDKQEPSTAAATATTAVTESSAGKNEMTNEVRLFFIMNVPEVVTRHCTEAVP